jgi:hypothetical protein
MLGTVIFKRRSRLSYKYTVHLVTGGAVDLGVKIHPKSYKYE